MQSQLIINLKSDIMRNYFILIFIFNSFYGIVQSTLPRYNGDGSQKLKPQGTSKPWIPSIRNTDYFDSTTNFFQNKIISYNDSLANIALYSELAAHNFWGFRVSVGVTFAHPKTHTNCVQQQKLNREKFLQEFTTGDGALAFDFALPLFVVNRDYGDLALNVKPRF
jgi:hypothetical protein